MVFLLWKIFDKKVAFGKKRLRIDRVCRGKWCLILIFSIHLIPSFDFMIQRWTNKYSSDMSWHSSSSSWTWTMSRHVTAVFVCSSLDHKLNLNYVTACHCCICLFIFGSQVELELCHGMSLLYLFVHLWITSWTWTMSRHVTAVFVCSSLDHKLNLNYVTACHCCICLFIFGSHM